jgi:2-isopropylmalate synthase
VGLTRSDLVLGKHSGRAALADRVKALGYNLNREQLDTLFQQFKVLADKKKEVYDGDLAALVEQQLQAAPERFALVGYQVTSGTGRAPEVFLKLRRGDQEIETRLSCGDGPVDAIFLAIEELTGITVHCTDFRVHSVTVGKDAQGEVIVVVEYEGQLYRGRGVSTDSVEAAAKAFLNAINRIAATGPAPAGSGNN